MVNRTIGHTEAAGKVRNDLRGLCVLKVEFSRVALKDPIHKLASMNFDRNFHQFQDTARCMLRQAAEGFLAFAFVARSGLPITPLSMNSW